MHDTILAHEVSIKMWRRLLRGKGFPKHDTMVLRKGANCQGFEKIEVQTLQMF